MIQTYYNEYFIKAMDGAIDHDNDTFNIVLLTSSYTPDYDNHSNYSDLTNEVVGTGYTAGGIALTNTTTTKDNTNDQAVFDADDVSIANSTLTARYAARIKDTGTPGTSTLIELYDFETDQSTTNTEFKITWNANGITGFKVTA